MGNPENNSPWIPVAQALLEQELRKQQEARWFAEIFYGRVFTDDEWNKIQENGKTRKTT